MRDFPSIHSILSVLRKSAPHRFPARPAVFQRMLFSRDLVSCHVVRVLPIGPIGPISPIVRASRAASQSLARSAVFRIFFKKIFPSAVRSAVPVPFIRQGRENVSGHIPILCSLPAASIFRDFHDGRLDKLISVCYFYFMVENCRPILQEVNDGKITDTLTV